MPSSTASPDPVWASAAGPGEMVDTAVPIPPTARAGVVAATGTTGGVLAAGDVVAGDVAGDVAGVVGFDGVLEVGLGQGLLGDTVGGFEWAGGVECERGVLGALGAAVDPYEAVWLPAWTDNSW